MTSIDEYIMHIHDEKQVVKSGASVGKVVAGSLEVFVVLLLAKSRGYVHIGHKA